MATVIIWIDRTKLPSHTDEEFDEWVKYNIEMGEITNTNPLCNKDFQGVVQDDR